MLMKTFRILSLAIAGSLLYGSFANAQTVATDPVGFLQPFATPAPSPQPPNMLANSDTQVSVPFTRPPEFVGATSAAASNTLTVSGSPWTANQFVYVAGTQPKTYFVLIGPHSSTNPKEGRMYQITSNTTNQLTVNNGGDDLSTVAATTQILVIPFHTLNSVFPASDANVSYIPSTNFALGRKTTVLIPNYAATGINIAPSLTYAYIGSSWKLFPDSSTDHGDDLIPTPGYFIVRNPATGGTLLTTLGSVLTKKATLPLFTSTGSTFQDNFVSLLRPIDVALNDLGLITSGAFVSSTNFALGRKDTLLVFDPTQTAINKAPSATYAYIGGAWKKFPDISTDVGATDKIPAGAGFIIRKAPTATGAPVYWTNIPTY
jgi:uncharacterized protein (TIGR02597 family)